MEVMEAYQFAGKNKSSWFEKKYDWPTLTNGKVYRLVRGVDFECEVNSFRASLHSKAKRSGMRVDISMPKDDENAIIFQFHSQVKTLPKASSSKVVAAADVAKATGLTSSTIIDLARAGKILCIRVGSRFRFNLKDVCEKLGA